jgi:uncharacterized C2H2 Zn-finger protein
VIVEDDPSAPDATWYADLDYDGRAYDPLAVARADADSKRTNRCADCGKWYMSRDQLSKHRGKVHAAAAVKPAADPGSQCWQYLHTTGGTRRCVRRPDYHDGAHEYETTVTPMSPVAAARVAPRTDTLAPCPRCGRIDWQTAGGRQWHLDNYPACASQRRPDKHQYEEIALSPTSPDDTGGLFDDAA